MQPNTSNTPYDPPVLSKAERVAIKKARKLARRKARLDAAAQGLPPPTFLPSSTTPIAQDSSTTTTTTTNTLTSSSPISSSSSSTSTSSTTHHNFASKFNDHFETPLQAYKDLAPLLRHLNPNSNTQIIYDPFYCQGSMVQHMNTIGFSNVINQNVDFWNVLKEKRLPSFDVVVTNPPYSDDDKEKTVRFICETKKPGFVLLPSYCGNKTWLKRATTKSKQEYFVVRPVIDYQYNHLHHKGHKDGSPFHSSWFCFNCNYKEMKSVSPNLVQKISELKSVGVQFTKRLSSKRRKAMKRKRDAERRG